MGRPLRLHDVRSNSSSVSASSPSPATSLYQTSSKLIGDTSLGHRIPGFHIPLAFLSSLRANLQISSSLEDLYHSSAPGSLTNTPDALCPVVSLSSQSLPSPSPLSVFEDTHDIPSLEPVSYPFSHTSSSSSSFRTHPATTEDDKTDALRLVADSVVQQRLIAARSIVLHPAILGLTLLILAIIARLLYRKPGGLVLVTSVYTALILAAMLTIKYLTRDYLPLAEQTGTWTWLTEAPQRSTHNSTKHLPDDEILVTKYNSEVIAALVLRTARTNAVTAGAPSANGSTRALRHRSTHSSSARLTGVIRAWTVQSRYRRRGIGTGLLEKAVEVCKRKRLDGPVFDERHANAGRVLPGWLNRAFERRESWARGLLREVIEGERESGSGRSGSGRAR